MAIANILNGPLCCRARYPAVSAMMLLLLRSALGWKPLCRRGLKVAWTDLTRANGVRVVVMIVIMTVLIAITMNCRGCLGCGADLIVVNLVLLLTPPRRPVVGTSVNVVMMSVMNIVVNGTVDTAEFRDSTSLMTKTITVGIRSVVGMNAAISR